METFVSLREAGVWSVVRISIGLGFGGLVWAWAGGGTAQAYLAGYLTGTRPVVRH